MFDIPLSEPSISNNEWKYIKECLDTGWVSSAGKYVELFEDKIAAYTGSKHAIACINGTSSIQLSLRLAGVCPGDEVIVPTLTFIAPINAVYYNGASPIFMDCDNYYNIDCDKVIDFLKNETVFKRGFTYNKLTNKKIVAIIPVHVWGNAVFLDELVPILKKHNINIIEDASESLGSVYSKGPFKNKHTGTIGKFGCLSFNGNKIITTGGGGAILTDDSELAQQAKYLTRQAKDDQIKYVHNEIGYNFRLSNIQAALGVAQLEQLQQFLDQKQKIHNQYASAINNIEGLSISAIPNYAKNNIWMNVLQINKLVYGMNWENLLEKLNKKGIQTRPVWKLNHLQKPYEKFQNYKIEKSKKLIDISLLLPSSSKLTEKSVSSILDQLVE